MYQRIEGGHWRHVWVVSDIHGCYQWLMDELKRRHFNPYDDLLISVGDIIDRGPDSLKCLDCYMKNGFGPYAETTSKWHLMRLNIMTLRSGR